MRNNTKEIKNFTRFFEDKNYIKLKNYLFNYLNRKRLIKVYSMNYIDKCGKILDIGCGVSPVTPLPKKTLFVDISKPALKVLKKEGYKTKSGSVTRMKIDNGSADAVFCSEVLEHVEDYKT